MLVLSRKETQRIRVGDSVVVTIVKISGDKVRIGIKAPDDVLVLRDELEAWDDSVEIVQQGTSTGGIAPTVAPVVATEVAVPVAATGAA